MKKLAALIFIIAITWAWAQVSTKAPVVVTNDVFTVVSPTNFWRSNIIAGPGITTIPTNNRAGWALIISGVGSSNAYQPASDNLTNWSSLPTGAMANATSTDYLTNWANAVSNYAAGRMTEVMTNAHGVAGGVRVGLATNTVWHFPKWSSFSTNNSGSNSVDITVQPYRPFAVIDSTNVFYHSPEWEILMDEEFLGDSANTVNSPANNTWNANGGTSGTAPSKVGPPLLPDFAGTLSFSTTAAGGRIATVGGATIGQMATTNCEVLAVMRVRFSHTNDSTDIHSMRAGLGDANTAVGDWANGIYMGQNTNANTNIIVCTTARASSRTITYTSASLAAGTWGVWAFWLDSTGTNVIFAAGSAATNLTSIATNSANIPGLAALVTPAWQVQRYLGSNARTNYMEKYILARRQL